MKPFDLQAALAGAPVVTKTGIKVLAIAHLPQASLSFMRVYAVLEGLHGNNVQSYDESGHVGSGHFDLFMAPKRKTLYINIWKSPSFHYSTYETLEAAKTAVSTRSANKTPSHYERLNPEPIEIIVEED